MKATRRAVPVPMPLDRPEHDGSAVPAFVLGLAAIYAVLLVGILAYSVRWGTVTTVTASGMLIEPQAAADVVALSEGRLARVFVRPGDHVAAGEMVAELAQPGLDAELARLEERRTRLAADIALITVLSRTAGPADSGLSTRLAAALSPAPGSRGPAACLPPAGAASAAAGASVAGGGLADLQLRLAAITHDMDVLRRERGRRGAILALVPGVVTRQLVATGAMVCRGEPLLRTAPGRASGPLVARLTVPADEGAKVRPGMEARVDPQIASGTASGFIEGVVEAVTPLGATGGVQVTVRLNTDLAAPSGYRWSSGRGPDVVLGGPMRAQARIVTDRHRFGGFGDVDVGEIIGHFFM